jgi:hypothetical protein
MYNLFLYIGSVFIVIAMIFLRIRYFPVLHPEAGLYVHLVSITGLEKGKHSP